MTLADPHEEHAAEGRDVADARALTQVHGWILDHWPTSMRRRVAVVVVIVAFAVVTVSWVARLVGAAIDLGVLAYLGLMAVCWVGAGGALVPVPGVRPLSWVMIVHQSTVLIAPMVVVTAALAMALGQSSYFLATRFEAHRHDSGRSRRHRHEHGSGADPATRRDATNRLVRSSRELLERGRTVVKRRMATHPQRIIFLHQAEEGHIVRARAGILPVNLRQLASFYRGVGGHIPAQIP